MIDSNAEHILAWIENSRPEYGRLRDIHRRRQAGCVDGFIRSSGAATTALNLVVSAYSQMCCGGQIALKDYSALDLLEAQKYVLHSTYDDTRCNDCGGENTERWEDIK